MSAAGKCFFNLSKVVGWAAKTLTLFIHLEYSPRWARAWVTLACRYLQDSESSSQVQDRNKLVSPPALGIMEPCSLGGLRSRFIAWISLLPNGRGSTGDMVASDKAPCAGRRGKRVRATFQLAADEPSGAYDFTRLLLCVGSEFPTQR